MKQIRGHDGKSDPSKILFVVVESINVLILTDYGGRMTIVQFYPKGEEKKKSH